MSAFCYNLFKKEPLGLFGDGVPFGDPLWYQGYISPFYSEKHVAWRKKCREYVETQIKPHVQQWEDARAYPKDLFRKMASAGVFAHTFPKEFGGTPPCDDFDIFYELIWLDELARCGSNGVVLSTQIVTMALPPILTDGSDAMKRRICREILTGEKTIALAITEGWAGSDVAGIRTTCEIVEKEDGSRFYKINGQKKWITTGNHADYFTLVCKGPFNGDKYRQSPQSPQGALASAEPPSRGTYVSLILVERSRPGVRVEKMQLQGNWCGGTAVVTFNDVLVPCENLIGKEGGGFKTIMKNFNHERIVISAGALRNARLCLEESVKRARSRKTFDKRLADSQVIRHKLANMAANVEQCQAFLEVVALQYKQVSDDRLGRVVSLLKYSCTKCFKFCALEAAQVFGGLAYTQAGVGGVVERALREMVSAAIPGGSEEIMLDLSMKLSKL